jgi:hypothetical protein
LEVKEDKRLERIKSFRRALSFESLEMREERRFISAESLQILEILLEEGSGGGLRWEKWIEGKIGVAGVESWECLLLENKGCMMEFYI